MTSNIISELNDDFSEDFFEVLHIFVGQKIKILENHPDFCWKNLSKKLAISYVCTHLQILQTTKQVLFFPNNFLMEFSIFVYCKFPVQKYIQHCNVGGHALLVLLTASERWMVAHIKSLSWPQEKRMWSLECHLVLLNMNGLPSSMTSQ